MERPIDKASSGLRRQKAAGTRASTATSFFILRRIASPSLFHCTATVLQCYINDLSTFIFGSVWSLSLELRQSDTSIDGPNLSRIRRKKLVTQHSASAVLKLDKRSADDGELAQVASFFAPFWRLARLGLINSRLAEPWPCSEQGSKRAGSNCLYEVYYFRELPTVTAALPTYSNRLKIEAQADRLWLIISMDRRHLLLSYFSLSLF